MNNHFIEKGPTISACNSNEVNSFLQITNILINTCSTYTFYMANNTTNTITPTISGVNAEWVELGSGTNICGINTTCP